MAIVAIPPPPFRRQPLLLLHLTVLLSTHTVTPQSHPAPCPRRLFPALFIFGDSLVDVGNNNYIITLAKANLPPNGIDFPSGTTGRFCNGKTVLDVISEHLDLPLIPAYLDPTTRGQAILNGVNYASGAGGILESSGYNYIGRVDFDTQIAWFGNTITELQQQLGVSAARDLVEQSLYSVGLGSNDYINNYFLPYSETSEQTPAQFQDNLLNKYSSQLVQLYSMGARNITVSSLGPMGCSPSQLAARNSVNGACSEVVNNLAINFNAGLRALLQQLAPNLPGSRLIYVDNYELVSDLYNNPTAYGLQYNSVACCGGGRYRGEISCLGGRRTGEAFLTIFHSPNGSLSSSSDILRIALLSQAPFSYLSTESVQVSFAFVFP